MSELRIGGLFEGYGGLTMGVQAALGGEPAWYSEIDKGALKILAHHHPDVPNIGDITKVDWSQVEPVDILTGGSPCQDLSHAGKRAGMTDGTRSNLWVAMREAIAQLRPGLVVWENVRGAYSAEADSDLVTNPRLLADTRRRDGEPVLRALGRVLGDLSDLGYLGGWHGLRAADIGAAHGRFRVFVVATNTERGGRHGWTPNAIRRPLRRVATTGSGEGPSATLLPTPATSDTNGPGAHGDGGLDLRTAVSLMPTPRATDGTKGGPNQRGSSGDLMLPSAVALLPTPQASEAWKAVSGQSVAHREGGGHQVWLTNVVHDLALLPTPAVNDMGAGKTPDDWDAWTNRMKTEHGNGNGHGKSLSIEAQRSDQWGDYAPAIARWEHVLGRPAPAPTQTSSKGNPQLSLAFVEWLMGLPVGHLTDVPGITRNEGLKAGGNGVVPQQAEAAVRFLLERLAAAA